MLTILRFATKIKALQLLVKYGYKQLIISKRTN